MAASNPNGSVEALAAAFRTVIEEAVEPIGVQLLELHDGVGDLKSEVGGLRGEVSNLKGDVGDLGLKIENVQDRLNRHITEFHEHRKAMETVTSESQT